MCICVGDPPSWDEVCVWHAANERCNTERDMESALCVDLPRHCFLLGGVLVGELEARVFATTPSVRFYKTINEKR